MWAHRFEVVLAVVLVLAGWARAAAPMPEALDDVVKAHLDLRRELITRLISEVAKTSDPRQGSAAESAAIRALGDLRATEAVDTLVSHIEYRGGGPEAADEFTVETSYGCVGALQKIGKPASLAAVKAIREMYLFDCGADENRRLTRIQLLTRVIRGVEGREVAKFMLERELKKVKPESKEALQEALNYLEK